MVILELCHSYHLQKGQGGVHMLKNKESTENSEIIEELERITDLFRANEQLFNMMTEDEMIEAIIFEQRSLQSRYAYLLKIARAKGIKIDFTDRL